MKFEDKYPDAEYLSVHDGLLKGKEFRPCWCCGELTSFVEINYEARICSEECLKAIDDEISASCSSSGYPNMMCFGQDLVNCTLMEKCPDYDQCLEKYMEYLAPVYDCEDEFEPGRVNVNMFGLNP